MTRFTISNPQTTTDMLDRLHGAINERRQGTTHVRVAVDDLVAVLADFHRYADIVSDAGLAAPRAPIIRRRTSS